MPTLTLWDWEVWLTYTSYRPALRDLSAAAARFVEGGLMEAVLASDGSTVWRNQDGTIGRGRTGISIDSATKIAAIELPPAIDDAAPTNFVVEAAAMHYAELKLFQGDQALPRPYIRCFLDPIGLASVNGEWVMFRPMVNIYDTGEISVALRMRGTRDEPLQLEPFVSSRLQLQGFRFHKLLAPPGLSSLIPRLYFPKSSGNPFRRLQMNWRRWYTIRQWERGYGTAKKHPYPANASGRLEPFLPQVRSDITHTTAELAGLIADSVVYASEPRLEDWRAILSGGYRLDGQSRFWMGRRHIHLITFQDQGETAAQNEGVHGEALGQIYAASTELPVGRGAQFLPKNVRLMGDVGTYVDGPALMWVWSQSAVAREHRRSRPAHEPGHFANENAVIGEMIEYGYILHRRLAKEANRREASLDDVLGAQESIMEWEDAMREVSPYGDLRQIFNAAWKAVDVPYFRERVARGLEIQRVRAQARDARATARWAAALSVLFGALAVPTFADGVIDPLWKWRHWQLSTDSNLEIVERFLIALGVVGAVWLAMMGSVLLSRLVQRRRLRRRGL